MSLKGKWSLQYMTRPRCPRCKKLAIFVNSHKRGDFRVKTFGCRACKEWSLGDDVVPVTDKRTRTVSSSLIRDTSGRFASSR